MLTAAIALLITCQSPVDSGPAYDGRARQLRVAIPRLEETVRVDGVLDEAVWQRAARLTGFSQYQPVDSRPAEEPTEVLVWYGPTAIHFGIRAFEPHGDVVRATSADRDNIGADDQVQILLDTYGDRRRAFLFGVNPLGAQQDGIRSDHYSGGAGGQFRGGGGVASMNILEGNVDLNPDFVFESRGRLTPWGYEVELRIPFKSLRYQDAQPQNWGVNVLRRTQHTGYQDSWAPVVRASASFIDQSGWLDGLHDLHRGLVLEATPTATSRLTGHRIGTSGWGYRDTIDLGLSVRWGLTPNLGLDGTVNPDFSQVEADVGQVTINERFALYFPEKRPFFLEGLELFDSPNQLIYTRQIVNPDVGVKLAGKTGETDVGALLAMDARRQSRTDSRPLFGALRLRRDVGRSSTLGVVATTREDGDDYSRLVGADVHIVHSRLYFVELQAVQSWTDSAGHRFGGPLLSATWDRTGRSFGFNYEVAATAPEFRARAGFVNRVGIVHTHAFNRFTVYGSRGSTVEQVSTFVNFHEVLDWDEIRLDRGLEGSVGVSSQATLRGGWSLGASVNRGFYRLLPADYASYRVQGEAGPTPFHVPDALDGLWSFGPSIATPVFRTFSASAGASFGGTAIFPEAARGRQAQFSASLNWRPTAQVRVAAQYVRNVLTRTRDDSQFSTEDIPRLKVEYQATRAIFVRFVGQYTARRRDDLRDQVSGLPLLVNGVLASGYRTNDLRVDWLFSYRPSPGTLVYLGYGSSLTEPEAFRMGSDLRRTSDGFFAKVSYVFRT